MSAAALQEFRERLMDGPGGLFVDYRRLPHEAWPEIAWHFGLELKAGGEALLATVADRWLGELFPRLPAR